MAARSIRNIVLVGHAGNGKTSLIEAALYRAGLVNRPGRVDDGTTVCDRDVEERERGHSLSLSTATLEWDGHTVNLIDTPGHADYRGEALLGMHAADLAVFVIDGVSGVQPQDTVLWRHAEQMKLPRMIFVNKLDRAHSSFTRTLEQIRTHFGSHTDPVELPIGQDSSFHGITDLLTDEAFVYDTGAADKAPIPDDMVESEREGHERLVEEVVEIDDEALERYLEGTEPSPEEVERLLHDAIDACQVFPVLCGSATAPIGADHFLDIVCRVGPAPGDLGPTTIESDDVIIEIPPDPDGETLATVFKTRFDEFLGQITIFKVLAGEIKVDDELVNPRTGKRERLHQLISLTGDDHRSIRSVGAGDIGAVVKLDGVATGDTLASPDRPVRVPPPELPTPVYSVVVKAKTPAHEDRLATVLRRLVAEDPTLAVGHDNASRQTSLAGAGRDPSRGRHLPHRAQWRGGRLGADPGRLPGDDRPPGRGVRASTRSRPAATASSASPMFGSSRSPGARASSSPARSAAAPSRRVSSRLSVPAWEEAMARGGVHGFPVVDIRAVCTDGKHHSVDSSEMSFKMAGSLAFRAALQEVGTVVLEPISEMTVIVPQQYQGDVLGDLNSRRGQVLGTTAEGTGDHVSIQALVPSSEIQRYAIDLRSMTGGTGIFEVQHHDYQPLPDAMVAQVALAETAD